MVMWNGAKFVMRRKNGPTYLPAPVLAGAVVGVGLLVGFLFSKRDSD